MPSMSTLRRPASLIASRQASRVSRIPDKVDGRPTSDWPMPVIATSFSYSRSYMLNPSRIGVARHHFPAGTAPALSFLYAPARAVCLRRSEEHTSELQSRENLVCRLLLEKK